MSKKNADRRKSTLAERTTACVCCGYPLSHRHHLMAVAKHGENLHTSQLCPNCHELFHILQETLVRNSPGCRKLLYRYLEVKGKDDSAFRFLMPKVIEVRELEETFTRGGIRVTDAMRRELSRYVERVGDMDILGLFGFKREAGKIWFNVVAHVTEKSTDGPDVVASWWFEFCETEVVKVLRLETARARNGSLTPSVKVCASRLERGGWRMEEVATDAGWFVNGHNGENVIRCFGETQAEAWYQAAEEARGLGMLGRTE